MSSSTADTEGARLWRFSTSRYVTLSCERVNERLALRVVLAMRVRSFFTACLALAKMSYQKYAYMYDISYYTKRQSRSYILCSPKALLAGTWATIAFGNCGITTASPP